MKDAEKIENSADFDRSMSANKAWHRTGIFPSGRKQSRRGSRKSRNRQSNRRH